MNNEYNKYREKILLAQFDVTELVCHQLDKGEMRESFVHDMINDDFPHLRTSSGFLIDEYNKQSPQCDCLITDRNAYCRKLGRKELLETSSCKSVLEVKSCATGNNFKKFNKDAQMIKSLVGGSGIKCGIFCYRIDLQMRNLLKKFGIYYHADVDVYEDLMESHLIQKGKKSEKREDIRSIFSKTVEYPNIDFVLSLHNDPDDWQFFLIRDGYHYVLIREKPIIKYFFGMLRDF